jgi:DNA-directed RNA polymerase alpha subunit
MKGYIKIEDILEYCKEAVETHEGLIKKALDPNGKWDDVSAAAYFLQQQKIFKYEIPNMVKELSGDAPTILSDNVNTLNVPTYIWRALSRGGISTIGELLEKSELDLKNIRGLGAKGREELMNALSQEGLKLRRQR